MKAPESIILRRKARELVIEASESSGVLDCTDIEFVNGGVTDELLVTAHETGVELLVESDSHVADMINVYEKIYKQNDKKSMEHTYTFEN